MAVRPRAAARDPRHYGGSAGGLSGRPPRVPLTMRSLHPKLAAIALQHDHDGWRALPNITDGHETYELVLTITQTRGRWLVSGVSNPR